MHFKAGGQKPKATVEIGDKTYQIKSPTLGQASDLAEALEDKSLGVKKQTEMMKKFVCQLGSIPMDELNKIENEVFTELFTYVVGSKKN